MMRAVTGVVLSRLYQFKGFEECIYLPLSIFTQLRRTGVMARVLPRRIHLVAGKEERSQSMMDSRRGGRGRENAARAGCIEMLDVLKF